MNAGRYVPATCANAALLTPATDAAAGRMQQGLAQNPAAAPTILENKILITTTCETSLDGEALLDETRRPLLLEPHPQ
ncbi:MAG TPA: hypothetical protein VMO26_03725 [Vicinamibacterales bacterium]|nr:hypothetical protein [Vicinamibacterales bacterium]